MADKPDEKKIENDDSQDFKPIHDQIAESLDSSDENADDNVTDFSKAKFADNEEKKLFENPDVDEFVNIKPALSFWALIILLMILGMVSYAFFEVFLKSFVD